MKVYDKYRMIMVQSMFIFAPGHQPLVDIFAKWPEKIVFSTI